MGKPTGFLEYERLDEDYIKVEERLQNYNEFTIPLDNYCFIICLKRQV